MHNKFIEKSVNLIPWHVRGWIKHIPVVATLQRVLFKRLFSNLTFVHVINAGPARGLKYPVNLPQDKAIWAGTYETPFAQALKTSVNAGDVCYDIGGYRGFFSGVMAMAHARLVTSFEPLPENYAQIRRLAECNPQLPLRVEAIAIGDFDGSVEFSIMPEASMGKIADSPFQPDAKGTGVLKVNQRTLDSLVASGELPPPQILKIDVEGAEVKVLEGARKVLRESRPRLFIEAHSPTLTTSCTSILHELGYHVTVMETGSAPNSKHALEICHLIAIPAGV